MKLKATKIKDDKYIIFYQDKYYAVNSYTRDLFAALEQTNNVLELSKRLKMSKKEVQKVFSKLDNQMEKCTYYNENLDLPQPLKIQWRITSLCNLKCKHCYLGETQSVSPGETTMKILDRIISSGVMEVTLTGGEALTVPQIDLVVEKLIYHKINVLIYTNAILLKSFIDKIDGIVDRRYLKFSISLDGTQETHDEIRGSGTFVKSIDGVKYALTKGYSVMTNSVLTTLNYRSIPKLYVMLDGLGVKEIQISNLVVKGRATSNMKLSEEQVEEFNILLGQALEQANNKSKLLYASMPDEPSELSKVYALNGNELKCVGHDSWTCAAGIGKATIDSDGNMYCCPFMKKSKLGNVLEIPIEEVWGNNKRYKFLKLLAESNNNSRLCIAIRGSDID